MTEPDPLPVESLVTVAMIAEELDVSIDTARRWTDVDRENGFPPEVERVSNVKFYERAAVHRWFALKQMTERGNNLKGS